MINNKVKVDYNENQITEPYSKLIHSIQQTLDSMRDDPDFCFAHGTHYLNLTLKTY